jgi:hypothetical protein
MRRESRSDIDYRAGGQSPRDANGSDLSQPTYVLDQHSYCFLVKLHPVNRPAPVMAEQKRSVARLNCRDLNGVWCRRRWSQERLY